MTQIQEHTRVWYCDPDHAEGSEHSVSGIYWVMELYDTRATLYIAPAGFVANSFVDSAALTDCKRFAGPWQS